MDCYIKPIASALILALTMAILGCGRSSSETQPTTSIGAGGSGAAKPKQSSPGPANLALKYPRVLIDTSLGEITIELDKGKAPFTVDNFLSYVEAGLYDQTIFHQVYKEQAVLAGGYTVNFTEV